MSILEKEFPAEGTASGCEGAEQNEPGAVGGWGREGAGGFSGYSASMGTPSRGGPHWPLGGEWTVGGEGWQGKGEQLFGVQAAEPATGLAEALGLSAQEEDLWALSDDRCHFCPRLKAPAHRCPLLPMSRPVPPH